MAKIANMYQSKSFQFGKLSTQIDPINLKPGFSPRMENVTISKKGSILTLERRKGFADILDDSGEASCRGLYHWRTRDGKKRLIGIFGSKLKAFYNNVWNTLHTFSNTENSQFFTFAPWFFHVYIANGSEICRKWDLVSTDTEEVTDAPKGKFITFHKNMLFHANITYDSNVNQAVRDSSFQLRWSGIDEPDTYDEDDVLNLDDQITGIVSAPAGVLALFTPNRTDVLTGSSNADFQRLTIDPGAGCVSHYGIMVLEGYIYYPSSAGVLRTSALERPKLISSDVDRVWNDINPQSLKFISGATQEDDRSMYWLCSTMSEKGLGSQAYEMNTIIKYNLNSESCEVYKTDENTDLTFGSVFYETTGTADVIFGTSEGLVLGLKNEDHFDEGSEEDSCSFVYETTPMFMDRPDLKKNFIFMRVYLESLDKRSIPVTFKTDLNADITVQMKLSASRSDYKFLNEPNSEIRFVLGTDKTGVSEYDFVDVPIKTHGHYLKIIFGDSTPEYSNLQFRLFAYEVFYEDMSITGSQKYV